MGLLRRIISVDYTEEDEKVIKQQTEKFEAVDEVIVENPPPSASSRTAGSSTETRTRTGATYANSTATTTTQSYPIQTRSGYQYTPSELPVTIMRGNHVCVTGRFELGTRDRLVHDYLRPLGLFFENNANYCSYLVIARTTGTGKIRDALRSRRRIYSERDFLTALEQHARAEGNATLANNIQRRIPTALDAVTMETYIRGC